jgi:hypothetical protein
MEVTGTLIPPQGIPIVVLQYTQHDKLETTIKSKLIDTANETEDLDTVRRLARII